MASFIFNSALEHVVRGAISFEVDTFKVMLCSSRYVPSQSHATRADVLGYEVVGEGYGAGGLPVTVVPDQDRHGSNVQLGGALWKPAGFTAAYAVYYRKLDGKLVAVIDFGASVVAKGAFTITPSTISFGYAS